MTRLTAMRGVFDAPPANFMTGMTTGAAIIGNGDILAAVGGPAGRLAFRLSKLDFWQARSRDDAPYRAGARAIGTLALEMPRLASASYRLEQWIHDATLRGRFCDGGAELSIEAWTPSGTNSLVVELSAGGREPLHVRPVFEIQDGNESTTEQGRAGDIEWHERRFEQPNLEWKTAVTVAMKALSPDGITLQPGEKRTLVLAAVTSHDAGDHRSRAVAMLCELEGEGLGAARRRHLDWWAALWDKCAKVEIGNEYLEDRYYGSHYAMASCCGNRQFAPGLFAWITDDNSAWGGDYHTNYNYEAPWWGVLTSNLVELADPYDQPVLDYIPRMRVYAKRFLNIRGAYCNVGFGPKGLHVDRSPTPYEEGLNFLGQKSNASFLAVNMVMRYYLTLDPDYARRVYPYIVEVMNFWEDYLVFENGRYISPDDCPNETLYYMMLPGDSIEFQRAKDRNPPLSLGLIRMISRAALEISAALGVDEQRRGKWRHILDHISAFPLTERNGKVMFDVCENGTTKLEELNMACVQHVYPANAVSLSSDPVLVRAAVDTILYKDLWAHGNAFSTIYAAGARVGVDPAMMLEEMEKTTRQYIHPNFLFQMCGGGIENCAGIPAGINEMLLQSHEGFLRLFPCWPMGRPARFAGLRAYGAFLVSAAYDGETVQRIDVVSERGGRCRVLKPWPGLKIASTHDGLPVAFTDGNIVEFETEAGITCRLEPT
ncbi:MAG: glycoside hydrolase family 95-like protein [bacterium]